MMLLLFTARVDRRAECVARFVVPRFLTAVVVFLLFFFGEGGGGMSLYQFCPARLGATGWYCAGMEGGKVKGLVPLSA